MWNRFWKWLSNKKQLSNPHYQQKLSEHQSKFRCSVCDMPSNGPITSGYFYEEDGYQNWASKIEGATFETEEWETPNNLKECLQCGRFYCKRHVYLLSQGYCQKCQTNVS